MSDRKKLQTDDMDEVYRAHARTVYKYLLSLCHTESIAEELMQETFYQAIRCLKNYDGSCQIGTWLCAIAKNLWLRYCKKHRLEEVYDEITDSGTAPSAQDLFFSKWNRLQLMRALHEVAEPMREVMYLRLSADLSFREIGEILGHTENWARVNYYRGKEQVLQKMEAL